MEFTANDAVHTYIPPDGSPDQTGCQHVNQHGKCQMIAEVDDHVILLSDLGRLDGDWTAREAYLHFTQRPAVAIGNHSIRFALLREYTAALHLIAQRSPTNDTVTLAELREAIGLPPDPKLLTGPDLARDINRRIIDLEQDVLHTLRTDMSTAEVDTTTTPTPVLDWLDNWISQRLDVPRAALNAQDPPGTHLVHDGYGHTFDGTDTDDLRDAREMAREDAEPQATTRP